MAAVRNLVARVKKLKDDSLALVRAGKFEEALPLYDELTHLEPTEGEWPRRAADCCWHLKRSERRLHYSVLAAKAYAESSVHLKAIAMCKVALAIDPSHKASQAQLAELIGQKPEQPTRVRPQGVRPLAAAPHDAAQAIRSARARREAADKASGTVRQAQRRRARMAASDALRKVRAKEATAVPAGTPAIRRPAVKAPAAAPAQRGPLAQQKGAEVLGRIALKAQLTQPEPIAIRELAPSARPKHVDIQQIPSLRVPTPPPIAHPALIDLRLSERVKAEVVPSSHPEKGNIYALTLGPESAPELRAAPLPEITFDRDPRDPISVVIPVSEPPPPASEGPQGWALSGMQQQEVDRIVLEGTPLFGRIPSDLLEYLIDIIAVVELEAHEVLFNQGDIADAMYVIVEGSVVAMAAPTGDRPIELARLEEGEFFGEIGLLSDQPRQASVSACEPTRLLRFDRSMIGFMVDQDASFLPLLLQFLKNRLIDDLMLTSPLFAPFDEHERQGLAEQFEFFEIEANSVLLDQGQHPIGMYVLLTGAALLDSGHGGLGSLRRLGPGSIFGEQALLRNAPSDVQVRTTSRCFALCLPSDAFSEVIMTHPTVLAYLANLGGSDPLHVSPEFLDHMALF